MIHLLKMRHSIKKKLKSILYLIPGFPNMHRRINGYLFRLRIYIDNIGKSTEKIWYYAYKNNIWGDCESVSGQGSTIEYTKSIRSDIPKLVHKLNIHRILDAPCGDFNWFRFVKLPKGTFYIGGDIVTALIDQNQIIYGSETIRFININIIKDMLPEADLWICRDAFIHFSFQDIFLTLTNFLKSNIPYILMSSYPCITKNKDIHTGFFFRCLNMELPPFNLSRPIEYLDDWPEGHPVRKLCLWDKQSISEGLIYNKKFSNI